jgi:serine protease
MQLFPQSLLATILLSSLLTACGGGGNGSGNSPTVPVDPVDPVDPTEPPIVQTYTLAGTVSASSSQAVDSDTNDPTRIAVANDDIASAQPIANPITLGGYVNQPGTGATGRSQQDGDIDDYFLISALAGQTITMLVADFDNADADLYLYDTDGNVVDFSIETGDIETLVIPADGSYLINAFAFAGATNYIFAIGAPSEEASSVQRHEIAPYQAIVRYKNDDQTAGVSTTSHKAVTQALGMTQRAGGRGRARLMTLHRNQVGAQQLGLGAASSKLNSIKDSDLRARFETLMSIKSLRQDPRVRYAEPNYRVRAMATPNDEQYSAQWHYPQIALPDAWEITTGSADIIVAVVDTGILSNHPDFAGQIVGGYDFISEVEFSQDGDGIDSNPEDPGGTFGGPTNSFHGSHVGGTIAARGNNEIGVAGSAYGSKIMPLRALSGDGSGFSYDVDQAVRYAAGLENDSGTVPVQRADIINLSLGGGGFIQSEQEVFDAVRAAGVIVVAAAGNEASGALSYPASYDNVISVSAVDIQRRATRYTNRGIAIDVAAPGGDSSVDLNGDGFPDGVLSTGGSLTGSGISFVYPYLNGTSMASPHVAGVMALMKSVNPDITPADIDTMLLSGLLTDDLGLEGRDDIFGHGLINAQSAVVAALEAAGTTPADNPHLVSSTNSLNYGSSLSSLEVVIRNGGLGELDLQTLTSSAEWLRIEPLDIDAAGLGTYMVIVDRSQLPAGIYGGSINAQSSVNNLAIRIFMSVGTAGEATDVGVVYVLLYESGEGASEDPVDQFASNGTGSEYAYQFDNVEPGSYEIVAGPDADNDLLICDAGEACGAWLTIDQPIRIDVSNSTFDLDFPVEYQVSIPGQAVQALSTTSRATKASGETAKARSLSQ